MNALSFNKNRYRQSIAAAIENERAGRAFGEVGRFLKQSRMELLDHACEARLRGDRIAVALSSIADEAISSLFKNTVSGTFHNRISIIATGGYGRGTLMPFSDLDLLLLHDGLDDSSVKAAIGKLLYPLWDAGLTVGYSVHTAKSALAMARDDTHFRTSLLDARVVCGAALIAENMEKGFRAELKKDLKKFVRSKIAEQTARHENSERSRYLAEPNIKEGRGGVARHSHN